MPAFYAAVLEELNKPLTIRVVENEPLQVGQVLVKIKQSGICGSQLHEIAGNKGNGKFLPHLLGHEGFGIVQETGPGVTHVSPGDTVVMHWRVGNGIEADFPKYRLYTHNDHLPGGNEYRMITSGKVTTLSEYSVVSENRLTRVAPTLNATFGALLGCGLSTALGTIDNECNAKFGESVLVIGCGGLGLSLIQAARLRGLAPIIGIDINPNKDFLARTAGVTMFDTTTEEDEKFDIILDTTGNPNVIKKAYEQNLSNAGRLILVGQPNPGVDLVLNGLRFFDGKGLVVKATQGGQTNPSEDIPRYVKLYQNARLPISGLVTDTYSLMQINKAFDRLRSGEAGRIMIKMGR